MEGSYHYISNHWIFLPVVHGKTRNIKQSKTPKPQHVKDGPLLTDDHGSSVPYIWWMRETTTTIPGYCFKAYNVLRITESVLILFSSLINQLQLDASFQLNLVCEAFEGHLIFLDSIHTSQFPLLCFPFE